MNGLISVGISCGFLISLELFADGSPDEFGAVEIEPFDTLIHHLNDGPWNQHEHRLALGLGVVVAAHLRAYNQHITSMSNNSCKIF